MKSRILAFCVASMLAFSAVSYAQDYSGLVSDMKNRLQSQGVNLSGACGAAQITVRVAYQLRNQGYRLLIKRGGNRAVFQSNGTCVSGEESSAPGFATDYLISLNEGGVGYDLLSDGGGSNGPQWSGPENAPDMVQRNLQNNAEAPNLDPVVVIPPLPPIALPPPVVVTPPTSSPEIVSLLQQIIGLQQSQLDVIQRVDQTTKDTNEHVISMDRTLKQTLGNIGTFVGKYIAPAIGGWLVARQMNNNTAAPVVGQ